MTQDLKAFCIICIIKICVITSVSAKSKNIHNWKLKLIIRNDISSAEVSKLLNCCLGTFIIPWLICLYCSNSNLQVLLTWVCYCIMFQYFDWNIFIFCPSLKHQPWRCTYFSAKQVFIGGIFLKSILNVWRFIFSSTSLQCEVCQSLLYP